jgi:hypothetical protein
MPFPAPEMPRRRVRAAREDLLTTANVLDEIAAALTASCERDLRRADGILRSGSIQESAGHPAAAVR